jgi:uncharacterized protein YfaS (alpha-2-macroglobulin family)
MGLLEALLRLPLQIVLGIWGLISDVIEAVFGVQVSWKTPEWVPATRAQLAQGLATANRHPRRSAAIVILLTLAVVGVYYGYRWYRDRPHPPEPTLISFNVTAPAVTDYSHDKPVVQPLLVAFAGSVAPIERVGKDAGDGASLQPALAGHWNWSNDRQLVFQPADDWPVGQHYTVTFTPKKMFAPQVRVDKDSFEFDSAPFTLKIAKSEFYQDPENAALKSTITEVDFSHPVDPLEFEKRISMSLEDASGNPLARKFVVNYDARKLVAFVHSEQLALPRDDTQLHIAIDKGVRSSRGGFGTTQVVKGSVAVPGLYSLKVASVDLTLVDNERFEPEQVLVVEMSEAVGEKDVTGAVHAWLLPEYNPETPVNQRNAPYDWSGAEVGEALLRQSQKLDLAPIATERDYIELHSFKYHADPNRYIYVQVDKGLRSFGGYVLGKNSANVIAVPDYPKLLRFMANGALLSLNGDKRIGVVGRNMTGMQVEIARVLPDQLQHLVTFNQGSYAKPELGSLSPDQITERFVQKVAFPKLGPGEAHYEGVDLGKYLDEHGKHGVFLLRLSAYDPATDEANKAASGASDASDASASEDSDAAAGDGDQTGDNEGGDSSSSDDSNSGDKVGDSRFVVVTDLGLIAKKSLDGGYDVFVQSIHGGRPVAGAQVEVIGKNGQTLVTQTSNADGQVHLDALDAYKREKQPAMFVVRLGDDLSFLPIEGADRKLDFSRFDIGGIHNSKDSGQLSADLFSDRGLYRPGDTFHIGMIVRATDWSKPLVGVPLEVEITDPRGLSVQRSKLTLGAVGFEEISYTPQDSAPTGTWTINLSLVKTNGENQTLGSTTVQVKEFLPDRMKATATLTQPVTDGWVKPDGLAVKFSLQNLFGTPAQNRRVEATLTLSPVFPAFRSYPDYRFFDPQHAKEGYSEPLGDKRTDANGEVVYALDLKKYGSATYRLDFLGKGYEADGGRSVAAEAVSMVSSLDYLVGTKVDGDLDYISRGNKRVVSVLAIDPHANRTAVTGLTAALVERRFVSILTKQDSGVYKYESRLKEVPISDTPLAIPATGMDVALQTTTPGNFAWVVKNAHGDELNRIEYSVAGAANLSRSLERNAELQLALSKPDYAAGETIEVAVRAPYAGSGLITIERDHVYAHAWFSATTTASVQKIKIPADFEGNGYINVQFIRDPSSDEIFMSPLSYGIVPFSVNRNARKLPVTVDTQPLIKPGQVLHMHVKTAEPSRVAVFVVDEGILQVAHYKLADPLDFFFRKRMLEVQTTQILDLILPEFTRLAAMTSPGGDADNMVGRFLNPFRKKHAPPVAYWSGLVDVTGEKDLTWTVPEDFNGKLRVMAVAVSAGKIGTFEGATTVRGDFVLSPNIPSIAAPGDTFEVSVGVANNLTGLGGKSIPVNVQVALSPQLEAIGSAQQSVALAERSEGVVLFHLRAKPNLGPATLVFTATSGAHAAKLTQQMSVRPAVPNRTEVALGNMGKANVDIKPLRNMFEQHAQRDAAASHSPLVLARGLSVYLQNFPHQCTEQLLSQGVPALVFEQHPEFGAQIKSDEPTPAARFDALMTVLRSRQNAEGGFGLWTATPESERYISAYAVQFMLEAKERGHAVPADMLDRANGYLMQLAADESDSTLAGLRERAFAVYLLTRQGRVMTGQLAAVRQRLQERHATEWKDDIAAAYLAASLKLVKADKEADQLIAGPESSLNRAAFDAAYSYDRYNDPLIRDSGTLYLIAKYFPDRAKALPRQSVQNIVLSLQRGWYNTLSSAMTILALDAYAGQATAADNAQVTIGQVAANGTAKTISKADGMVIRATFDGLAQAVRISNGSDFAAWYSVSQTGFDRALPTTVRKDGLEIVRDYTDADGKPIGDVTLGAEIQVHLKIRATRDGGIGNVAIVDLLPGGFEAVQETRAQPSADADAADATKTNADASTPAQDASTAATPAWQSPVGVVGSTWTPEYADVRDDRVVIYGTATTDVREFVYRIKSTNAGSYAVPPAYGESLYDRTVQAQSLGGQITVVRKP